MYGDLEHLDWRRWVFHLKSISMMNYCSYLALFMVGWSPALWTVGYSIIATGDEDSNLGESSPKDTFFWTTLQEGLKRIMNPPLYGVSIPSTILRSVSHHIKKSVFSD
jgi:predicted permease